LKKVSTGRFLCGGFLQTAWVLERVWRECYLRESSYENRIYLVEAESGIYSCSEVGLPL